MTHYVKKLSKVIKVLATSCLLLTACSTAESVSSNHGEQNTKKKVQVVTSFYPMYDFTKNVAGDYADIVTLIPPGVEPHDWEPKIKDMEMIQQADVFVYNGAGMEGWVHNVLGSITNNKLKVVEASKGIPLLQGTEKGTSWDPHVWLDPVLAQKQVLAIEQALEQADPIHKVAYKKNAEAYIGKLQDLDKEYKQVAAAAKQKEFVTQHAAFSYLAREYGLQQIPIEGLSPEQEPTPVQMADIIQLAKEHHVKTIFFETLTSPKVADTVAREIGAKTAVLNPIEGLTDQEKAEHIDYLAVMKNNLEALKKSLNE
jgi:zinc transport system substrate-binding protein